MVSCAHVMGRGPGAVYVPSPVTNRSPTATGNVVYSELPPLNLANQDCNRFATPDAGRVDLASARVAAQPGEEHRRPRPSVTGLRPASKMSSGQRVRLVGKTSGLVNAQLGPVTIWQ